MFEFITQHGAEIVAGLMAFMALLKIIIRLTPTLEDDKVFARLDDLFNAIIPAYKPQKGKDESKKS